MDDDDCFPVHPTSTEFTVGADGFTGTNGDEYVAYLFADTPGKIKCGKYTGGSVPNKITTDFQIQTYFFMQQRLLQPKKI